MTEAAPPPGTGSRHADLTIQWADGEHTFRMAIGQIRELQEKTDCGPMELLRRIVRGTWRLDDVRETIRLGLIGGGKDPLKALSLVSRYVDPPRPLAESVPVAQAILSVLLFGSEDEPRPKAGAGESSPSRTEGSPSPASTGQGQS